MIFSDAKLPLNSLEKFMLAHESKFVAYNSQLCVEWENGLELNSLIAAVDKCIDEIPLLRSRIEIGRFSFERSFSKSIKAKAKDVIDFHEHVLTQAEVDNFCQKKFELYNPPLFRISVSKLENNKQLFIFNVHHTLCDATGQFHIMEEIFRVLNGLEVREGAKSEIVFRYRDLTSYLGWSWVLKNIREHLRPLAKLRSYQMASLIDFHDRPERFVTSRTIYLTLDEQEKILRECKSLEISITEYLTANCFRAMDKCLIARGDLDTPIMVYLPKTLRPFLKIRYSLQNILTTVLIVGKRKELNQVAFYAKIKHIINSHKMDKAAKFIFSSLLPTSFTPPNTIQKFFFDLDQNAHSITSSMLISAGRVPRSFIFPHSCKNITVWARGTMLKSPGIGVVFTGVQGSETITIEYLKELTKSETIDLFENNLMSCLLETDN